MYTNEDTKLPSLLPSIVCYADVLGFREMIVRAFDSGTEEEFLRKVKKSLSAAYKELHEDATTGDSGYAYLDSQIIDLKLFTDDIVVGYPLYDPGGNYAEPEFGGLLTLFAQAQANLAADGFLLRGAITMGQHYQDNDIAYGNALLEAVALNKPGDPPRLVIGQSVEPLIFIQLSAYGRGWAPHYDALLEDPYDGRLFVNYLGTAFEYFPEEGIDFQLLENHKKMVYRGLQENESNLNVRRKYTWLSVHHNYVCRTFGEGLLAGDHEGLYADEIDLEAVAEHVLEYLLPFDFQSTPQRLDLQRLEKRIART